MRIFRCSKSAYWWVEFRRAGKRHRRSLRVKDREAAQSLAARFLNDVEIEAAGLVKRVARTIEELIPAYERVLIGRGNSLYYVSQVRRYLERYLPRDRRASDFPSALLESIVASAPPGRSRRSVHEVLRAFYRWLFAVGELRTNPMAGVKAPRYTPARLRRALTRDELRALLRATPFERACVYLVAARTGLRKGEIRQLEWSDLDLDRATITVRACASKNRTRTVLPLAAEVVTWLRDLKSQRTDVSDGVEHTDRFEKLVGRRVFPIMPRIDTYYTDLAAAGIARVTGDGVMDFHALRVTFVTHLALEGVSLTLAQRLARHSTPVLTALIYTRYQLADERQAVERTSLGAVSCPDRTSKRRRAA